MIKRYEHGTLTSRSLSSISLNHTCILCQLSLCIHRVRHSTHFIAYTDILDSIEKYFAAQSLDNQILIYSTDNFRQNRKKRFAGHSVAGYACQVGFSPDGKWISSGDGEGNVVFWDWKTGRIKSRMKAHSKVVIAHEWLPHETVRMNFSTVGIIFKPPFPLLLSVQGYNGFMGWSDKTLGAC